MPAGELRLDRFVRSKPAFIRIFYSRVDLCQNEFLQEEMAFDRFVDHFGAGPSG